MTARTSEEEEEECSNLYLPAEIWDCIFKFFDGDNSIFKSLSIVSKQFLSLTNRLRFSFTITDKTIPFLSRLFHRFSNLTSLRLILSSNLRDDNDFNALLRLISTFPNLSSIKSLFLSNCCSNIPTD
ncbi:F-box/LRR-repeat protein, partial [Trifolium medium]|nr:F-box/LRR-repeat protein [Trifolium medium]